MFDAAAVAVAAETVQQSQPEASQHDPDGAQNTADAAEPQSESQAENDSHITTLVEAIGNLEQATTGQPEEPLGFVFIDARVADYQTLAGAVKPGTQVVILDGTRNGLEQISSYLADKQGVSSISIISHGGEGVLHLGTLALTSENLAAHTDALATIGGALTVDGDILLYGCDVASGQRGQTFVADLALLTGADIAASVDATGAMSQGGNWTLESRTGEIDTEGQLTAAVDNYSSLLATITFDGVDGTVTDAGDYSGTANPSTNASYTLTNGKVLVADGLLGSAYIGPDFGTGIVFGVATGVSETAGTLRFSNGEAFDLTGLVLQNLDSSSDPVTYTLTTNTGQTVSSGPVAAGGTFTFSSLGASFLGITSVTLTGTGGASGLPVFIDSIDVSNIVDPPPTVTDARISISGASGTGGAFRAGDTVTVTWNNTASGDNNAGITGVTVDFSQFGGGSAVAATNSGGTWSASYTITAGSIDATNRNVSVTATNAAGSTTTADTTNATVDNQAPTATDGNVSISGGSGPGGAFKIGDTVTVSWNNTSGGDNNGDAISGVTVDFSQFGGGSAVSATDSGGTWTATYTITAGSIDATNRNISVTVTDNAGNTATVSDTTNAVVDNQAPVVTEGNVSISGASGTGGAFKVGDTVTATWNNTAGGDNNADTLTGVTFDFSQFGGGTAVAATNSGGTWTATYTITAGSIDGANLNVSVTATDNAGNTTTVADATNAVVDSQAPTVTDGNISISGATGTAGAFKVGDTITATWNNTAGGDNNPDTIAGVTFDFSQFGGGSAVAATNSAGTWTATYTITAGALDAVNRNVSMTATDNAGNATTVADTTNAVVDNQAPVVSDGNISISGASGTGGAFKIGDTVTVTWNNTAAGDNNADIAAVSADFSQFGGGSAVAATNSGGVWTASYTITSGSITATNRNVSITATDNAGNTTTTADTANATVDNQAPSVPSVTSITTDSGASGTDRITNDTTLQISGTADASATVTVLLGGVQIGTTSADLSGNWTFDYTGMPLGEGSHAFTATATDASGNVSGASAAFNVTVDTTAPAAPAITGVSSDTGASSSDGMTSDPTLIINGTAQANATVEVFRGGVSIGTTTADGSGNWSFDYTGTTLSSGSYAFTATAADAAGNVSAASASYNVTVDTIAPAAPSVTGISSDTGTAGDGTTTDQTLVISGVAEANARITVFLDGNQIGTTTANGTGDWSYDYTGTSLAVGGYAITATATDAAGNTSVSSTALNITIVAGPAAPVVTGISGDTGASNSDRITNDQTLTISGTAEANRTITVLLGGTIIGTTTSDGSGNWTFDYTGTSLAGGTHVFTATSTDGGGNESAPSSNFSVTIDISAPSAPVITAISSDTGSSNNDGLTNDQTLTLTGTAEANSTVELFRGGVSIGSVTADGSGNWSFNYTATTLANGSYSFTAAATDIAGNTGPASTAFNVTIDTAAPAAPVISGITNDTGSSNDGITSDQTLVITGTAEANSVVELLRNGVSIGTTTANSSGAWSFDYTGTSLAEGTYAFTARATDLAGNTGSASAAFNVTVDVTAPTAPTIVAVTDDTDTPGDGQTTDNTLVFTGTGPANTTIVLFRDGAEIGTTNSDGSGNWTYDGSSSPLTAGSYVFTARSRDVAGNLSGASSNFAVTVIGAPIQSDEPAPPPPPPPTVQPPVVASGNDLTLPIVPPVTPSAPPPGGNLTDVTTGLVASQSGLITSTTGDPSAGSNAFSIVRTAMSGSEELNARYGAERTVVVSGSRSADRSSPFSPTGIGGESGPSGLRFGGEWSNFGDLGRGVQGWQSGAPGQSEAPSRQPTDGADRQPDGDNAVAPPSLIPGESETANADFVLPISDEHRALALIPDSQPEQAGGRVSFSAQLVQVSRNNAIEAERVLAALQAV
jgi:hypothetical protein